MSPMRAPNIKRNFSLNQNCSGAQIHEGDDVVDENDRDGKKSTTKSTATWTDGRTDGRRFGHGRVPDGERTSSANSRYADFAFRIRLT